MINYETYVAMVDNLRKAQFAYYILCKPVIADVEYDKLFNQVKEFESHAPDKILSNSPTQNVGCIDTERVLLKHETPMLSLDNLFSGEETLAYVRKIGIRDAGYVVEPKLDGASLSLTYIDGLLTTAIQRGDGIQGEDVTAMAQRIVDIPNQIGHGGRSPIVVRGEVVMLRKVFEKLNEKLREAGKTPYVNPRNAAAGCLRRKSDVNSIAPLTFIVYNVAGTLSKTHTESLNFARANRFTLPLICGCCTMDHTQDMIDHIETKRDNLPYDIDGAVIKVDNLALREALGNTNHHPNWAIAYKYQAEEQVTTLEEVIFQVGAAGQITPVAKLTPVLVGGVTVSSATLHNVDEMHRLGICTGDKVYVRRAGDVVPQITGVDLSARLDDASIITYPDNCPVCSQELKRDGVHTFCCNTNCPAQLKGYMLKFTSRKGFYVDGWGKSVINDLVAKGMVTSPDHLFTLTVDDILKLPRQGQKSANKLVAAMKAAKRVNLARFIYALQIGGIGEGSSKRLAEHFGTFDAFWTASDEELKLCEGVGQDTLYAINQWFANATNVRNVTALLDLGVTPLPVVKEETTSTALEGHTVAITGSFPNNNRDELKKMITAAGGKNTGLSKRTSYLLVGDKPGSKLKSANDYGIKILTVEDLLKLIES